MKFIFEQYDIFQIMLLVAFLLLLILLIIFLIKKYLIWTETKEGVSWIKAILIILVSSVSSVILSGPISSIFHNSDRSCESDTLFGCGFADAGEGFVRIISIPILFAIILCLLFSSMKKKKVYVKKDLN